MTDFFKRTQVPQGQRVQSKAPSGPNKDIQAHADAQRSQGGFGGAIQSLLGVATEVIGTSNKLDAQEEQRLEKNFALRADADVSDFGSYSKNYISQKALDEGRDVEDYAPEELEGLVPELKSSFKEAKGLNDKEYSSILDRRLDARGIKLAVKQDAANQVVKKRKAFDALTVSATNNLKTMEPADFVDYIKDTAENSVGPDAELKMTHEEFKSSFVQSLVPALVQEGNPELVAKLESKEMKEYLGDQEGYDNIISIAKQKATSVVNKRKNLNFDKVEEGGYTIASAGGFKTEEDVDNYLKQQQFKEGFEPNSKDMFKLQRTLKKEVATNNSTLEYSAAIKNGDFTYLERNNVKKKDADDMQNKFMSTEVGITDMTGQGIVDAINSGEVDSELKQYAMSSFPVAPAVVQALTVQPTGGVKSIKAQSRAFLNLNTVMQDTPTPLTGFLNKKTYARHIFTSNIMEKVDSGLIDDREFFEAYTTFSNDINKNVDSYGSYVSPTSAILSRDEAQREWVSDFAKDAPWTTDDNSSPAYISRQITGNFNLMIDAGYQPSEAREKAERLFEDSHMRFENNDGSEGVMPYEFKDVLPESLGEVAANLPSLQGIKDAETMFGSEFLFRRKLAVRPASNYEKTKLIQVYYDGTAQGQPMSRRAFDAVWSELDTKESKAIRKRYEKRLEKKKALDLTAEAEGKWKFRTN